MNYKQLDNLFDRLWPICRSITGPGISDSLKIIQEYIPIKINEIATGETVFDWTIPQEWELKRATLKTEDGEVILDTGVNNLHVLNFSEPFKGLLTFEELENHLYSVPHIPEAIPYVTSYYVPRWGLCLSEKQRKALRRDINYFVDIDTKKFDGALRYGDYTLQGNSDDTILISSYICHPSLANNELSGPLALISLFKKLSRMKDRYFSYRFIIIPETIGSIGFLASASQKDIENIKAGMVLTCLGGPSKKVTFKQSRRHWINEGSAIDDLVEKICCRDSNFFERRQFTATEGSDERQFCSPAINLPVIQAARTVYGKYDQYHTNLDNKEFMRISSVMDSVEKILFFLRAYELNRSCLVSKVKGGEPMLGKRGLYPTVNSSATRSMSTDEAFDSREQLNIMLDVISLVDGKHTLDDIVEKLDLSYCEIVGVLQQLIEKGMFRHG